MHRLARRSGSCYFLPQPYPPPVSPSPQGFNSDQPGVPGYDNAVLSHYFNEHLPRAAAVAEELRQRGGEERYVFLTHVRGPAGCCLLLAGLAGAGNQLVPLLAMHSRLIGVPCRHTYPPPAAELGGVALPGLSSAHRREVPQCHSGRQRQGGHPKGGHHVARPAAQCPGEGWRALAGPGSTALRMQLRATDPPLPL